MNGNVRHRGSLLICGCSTEFTGIYEFNKCTYLIYECEFLFHGDYVFHVGGYMSIFQEVFLS